MHSYAKFLPQKTPTRIYVFCKTKYFPPVDERRVIFNFEFVFPNLLSTNKSDEYTTATETDSSDEDTYNRTGVQFVKPKIYETGGGEWKPVRDNTTGEMPLTLEQKLNKWGINQSRVENL